MTATAAVVLLGAGVFVVVDRDGEPASGSRVRDGLLAQAVPDPDCPDADEPLAPGEGEIQLDIVRLRAGCLQFSAEVVDADRSDARLGALRAEPDVVAADRHAEYEIAAPPGATRSPGDQWPLDGDHLDGDRVRELWPVDAPEVKVAVVDTGIDDRNLDLAGQVVAKGPPYGSGDAHGTHVAGIVAAADDGAGVIGLVPRAHLLDVPFGARTSMGEHIRWSVDHGAAVINISAATDEPNDVLEAGVVYAERNGVVVVAGAGSCGSDDDWSDQGYCTEHNSAVWPARYPTVLSVAAHSEDDERWPLSGANESVDIAAPGDTILSDWRVGEDCRDGFDGSPSGNQPTCELSGTSMATPHVAATAALLLARQPDASPAAIREAITGSARQPEGHVAGIRSDEFGYGLLDPPAAADYLNRWPNGKGWRDEPPTDGGAIAGDTIVAGYSVRPSGTDAGTGRVMVARADGSTTLVQGAAPGERQSDMAFSPDGRWFATTGSGRITFVDATSGRQRTYPDICCAGVAFTADGLAVSANPEAGTVSTYDPETADRVTSVTPDFLGSGIGMTGLHVVGVAGELIVADAGIPGLVGIDPSGRVVRIGPGGPSAGIGAVAISEDGTRIAYASNLNGGGCGDDAIVVVDLTSRPGHEGTSTALAGPAGGGDAVADLRFDGDTLVAAWMPPCANGGSGSEREPPQLWSYAPVASDFDLPATIRTPQWEPGAANRGYSRPTPTGEAIYTELVGQDGPDWHYQLWLGPRPQGQGSTLLADEVTWVAARPNIPLGGGTSEQVTAWQRFAPKVILAEGEDHEPMSASAYIDGARLVWSHHDGCDEEEIAARGDISPTELGAGLYANQETDIDCEDTGTAWLTTDPTRPWDSNGPPNEQGFLLDGDNDRHEGDGTGAPAYVQYEPGEYALYWFFYPWNDAPLVGANHEGDWERVAVRLDPSDQPTSVVYWAHGHPCSVPWAQAPKDGDQPLVLSAKGTHASYRAPGEYPLPLGFDDHATAGDQWDTWGKLRLLTDEPWWGYAGGWGEVGPYLPELEDASTGPAGPNPLRTIDLSSIEPCS